MPKEKWSPPDKQVEARIQALQKMQAEVNELEERVKAIRERMKPEVTSLVDPDGVNMPVAALADALKVQRKTIYRYTGREMS